MLKHLVDVEASCERVKPPVLYLAFFLSEANPDFHDICTSGNAVRLLRIGTPIVIFSRIRILNRGVQHHRSGGGLLFP